MTATSPTQGAPKRILLATDLSARCDRALDRAATLATQWGAELVVVHAIEEEAVFTGTSAVPSWRLGDPEKLAELRVRADIRESATDVTVVAKRGDPVDVILEVAETRGCDLIVTGVARDELLGRFLLGNSVDRLLRRSPLPVLVVRRRGRRAYANIVLATDFSDSSRYALERLIAMFPQPVPRLFHAYDAPLSGLISHTAGYRQQFRTMAKQDSEAFLAQVDVSAWRGREPVVVLEYGAPDSLLFDYVRDEDVDLVVLGTHGRSGIAEAFLGSVAKRVMAALPCDALVVTLPQAARDSSSVA